MKACFDVSLAAGFSLNVYSENEGAEIVLRQVFDALITLGVKTFDSVDEVAKEDQLHRQSKAT